MIKSTKKTKATHTTRPHAAKLETPKVKPASPPQAEHHKEIRAEQFTLVDDAGNEHARLRVAGGGAVLTMFDSQGRPRLRLRAGDKEAMITILGERQTGAPVAADEVERVRIGYDSDDQNPRIAIQDGNENECVSLSLCGDGERGEGKSGVVHLERPRDGAYAVVDHMGLGVYTGSHELLAECAALPEETSAKPAATTEPTPIGATASNGADDDSFSGRGFSDEEAEALADEMLAGLDPDEANEIAAAVLKIADHLTYERDLGARELSFFAIGRAIYSHTADRDDAMMRFAKTGGAKFGRKDA